MTVTIEQLQAQIAELQARYPVAPKDPVKAGFETLVCRKCGNKVPANHENPNEGGCSGYAHESHAFYGADPVAPKE